MKLSAHDTVRIRASRSAEDVNRVLASLSPEEIGRILVPFQNLRPLLRKVHGEPVMAWVRLLSEEYAKTRKIALVRAIHSLCSKSGIATPDWVHEQILEESHQICDALLAVQTNARAKRSEPNVKVIRDIRAALEAKRTATRLSRMTGAKESRNLSKAFEAVRGRLPDKRGDRMSAVTVKRAYYRVFGRQN